MPPRFWSKENAKNLILKQILERRFFDEEEQIHRRADSICLFDLRLEIQGVLKSWAVPKGAPKKIGDKYLAIFTEDHPLEYAKFEGIIPEGNYGAGKVKIWDRGTFENLKERSLADSLKKGVIAFRPKGKRLKGYYVLIHFRDENWLWIKVKDRR